MTMILKIAVAVTALELCFEAQVIAHPCNPTPLGDEYEIHTCPWEDHPVVLTLRGETIETILDNSGEKRLLQFRKPGNCYIVRTTDVTAGENMFSIETSTEALEQPMPGTCQKVFFLLPMVESYKDRSDYSRCTGGFMCNKYGDEDTVVCSNRCYV